ncbi:hypothetical protein [Dyadobacter psychrophilus]|uniref:YD repeat-containing protein n=1 Tax=Dyadobacter psychrophilus TaxID=651661 RepID=A0A1T5CNX5_9BACT|nr:hypothetical protein [Dyadobacter psychrophilus]SKB61215.1 hypothetical protein SAMN05660293_01415 [Dyadobacter psychrophilus]
MKLFNKALTITKVFITAGLIASCQSEKDAVVSPVVEQAEKVDENAKISADSKLISDFSRKLSYSGPRNLLAKETLESYNYYIDYVYTAQGIKATKYEISSQKAVSTSTYILNASGLCIESSVGNSFSGTTQYKYNDNQQLILAFNKFEPNERQEFKYSSEPNGQARLLSVSFYDKQNYKTRELIYSYVGNMPDLYPLNPDFLASGTGKYLPIFGKFSPYLIKMVSETEHTYHPHKEYTSAELYNYKFYADGRVKSIEASDVKTGNTYMISNRTYASAMVAN